jgi:hypothetical protein
MNKKAKIYLRIRRTVNESEIASTSEPNPESESTSEPNPESESTSEPNPESESTSEPSPESESTSEPNPESESTSEPTPESDGKSPAQSEPEPQSETWPEPGPEWEKAYKLWQSAWPAHTYIFAIIFLLMAIYSGYYIVVNVKDGLGKKYLSISLNVMMCVLSITRSFVLFVDPYHQGTLIENKLVLQLMWSIGTPCLLASDSLCILALAESASVNLIHQRFQRLSNILIVIFLHFVLVIATDIVVSAHSSAKVMILYCQVFSIIWGTLLGIWYSTLAHKINHVLFKGAGRTKSRGDRIYLLLIYLSSVANLLTCVLILYSAVGVFGIYSEVEFVDAWPWYSLQTGMRVSEVIAAVLVFTVSAKRNRIKNKVHNVIVCGESQVVKETSDASSTAPTVNNLYPAARNRRMSMFSAVHQSKISAHDNPENDQKLDSPSGLQPSNMLASGNKNNPSPRGRRMSLFSELHESKLSASRVGAIPQRNQIRNKFPALDQSLDGGNSNVRSTNDNENTSGRGRRMSMFSQLQQIKLSANANNPIPSSLRSNGTSPSTLNQSNKSPALGRKRTPPSLPNHPEVGNQSMPSNRGRRMSMFSQLQELKMSANGNISLPSAHGSKNSIPDQKEDANTKTSSIFSGLQQFVASHKRKANKSDECGENTKHSNFFSKLFHTKVAPANSASPKDGTRLKKITALCRSVETASPEVHVNDTPCASETDVDVTDTPSSHENKTIGHVIDMPDSHDHATDTPSVHGNMTDKHLNDMPNARGSGKNIEWRRSTGSRASLFADLRKANTKMDEMKIIEDDEGEVEEQCIIFNRRKSSRTCAIDIDRNDDMCNDNAMPMQNMSSDPTSISKQSDHLTQVDV